MNDASDTRTVLVADDDAKLLGVLYRLLVKQGYRVLQAHDGNQAWDMVRAEKPDLVLLDVMMPGMSGWEVCRRIREDEELGTLPVIMLTGIGERLNELTSPLYGANDYIDKPFEIDDFTAKVKKILDPAPE